MKQFDLQGNEYDCTIEIPLKKATYEDIQTLNINLQTQLFVKDKEIERLNNIIKEVREYIENSKVRKPWVKGSGILKILDKGE